MLVDYAEASKDKPDLLMRVLERLMDHVDCHFTTEETLMANTGYVGADAAEHVAEHRQLTATADVLLTAQREAPAILLEARMKILDGRTGNDKPEA